MTRKSDAVRDEITERLLKDLVGPRSEEEVLKGNVRPSDTYLTGILWPVGEKMDGGDDDGQSGDDEDSESSSSVGTITGAQRPCSMGLSFAIQSQNESHLVVVGVSFGTYVYEEIANEDGEVTPQWRRRAWSIELDIDLSETPEPIYLELNDLRPELYLHFRVTDALGAKLVTTTLINRSPRQENRREGEEVNVFQSRVNITPKAGTVFVPRPSTPYSHDEEQKNSQLLYAGMKEYCTGHQCSAEWKADQNPLRSISTTWVPITSVPSYKDSGDEIFSEFIASGFCEAERISNTDPVALRDGLMPLVHAYQSWVDSQEVHVKDLSPDFHSVALSNIKACRLVAARIERTVEMLATDYKLYFAFKMANRAMALQHSWKIDSEGNSLSPLSWRPFQLGFILMSLSSTCVREDPDRELLDLLWFPTGGGKTEAYLTLIAAAAWYRRINTSKDGGGNVAVMRYTLRLLTSQQFQRASSMMLANELLRRKMRRDRRGDLNLENVASFSIGLWVGGDATPNDFDVAKLNQFNRDGTSAEQIKECPCCKNNLDYKYDERRRIVRPSCRSNECDLGVGFGDFPVLTVDDDIYRVRPTLIIGTVDKFAQLPVRPEMKDLFGFRTTESTDLIVQDELHLISGPLGTVTGIYETAFDWLLVKGNSRPKIIGSTATIRRAAQQVRALFDRESCQFPPSGISYDNSGFAVVDYENRDRWRSYVGLTTAGRSAKFALQAIAGSLLQSGDLKPGMIASERNGYFTLLCYFNSLRELGGAIVQMLDDVPDSIKLYSQYRDEKARAIGIPQELTSRETQAGINRILGDLSLAPPDRKAVDVVLATNMVSVGVDVPRLGLMMVNGQPKTRSEYIQATSRVGRSNYPGLVVNLFNSQKARDRSHFETFQSWHSTIYRDVEATSVTPFASRSRDRSLKAVLVSMIRHGVEGLDEAPQISDRHWSYISEVIAEIERRVDSIDPAELSFVKQELDDAMRKWKSNEPAVYRKSKYSRDKSLVQNAEDYARHQSAGTSPGIAWPVMNTMRTVEPATRFRMAEGLAKKRVRDNAEDVEGQSTTPWRRT